MFIYSHLSQASFISQFAFSIVLIDRNFPWHITLMNITEMESRKEEGTESHKVMEEK